MEPEPRLPQRSYPAHPLPVTQDSRPTIYFVTVCAKNRRPILANPSFHSLLLSAWQAADTYLVGRYVIMPDHIHFFCGPALTDSPPLATWMRYWKSQATKHALVKDLWQSNHWDTQLRQSDSYSAKWIYVVENPVRASLVANSDDWPYQGELHHLPWSD